MARTNPCEVYSLLRGVTCLPLLFRFGSIRWLRNQESWFNHSTNFAGKLNFPLSLSVFVVCETDSYVTDILISVIQGAAEQQRGVWAIFFVASKP